MDRSLYSRNDIDRLNVSSKEGGNRFASIEDYVDASKKDSKNALKRAKKN